MSDVWDEISADSLWEDTSAFSILTRLTASEDERKAAERIKARLEAWDIPVHVHEFDALLSVGKEAQVRVLGPEQREIQSIPHASTPSTPAEGLEGRVVQMASVRDDGAGRGAIVLVDTPSVMQLPGAIYAAETVGALAMLHVSHDDRLHEMSVSSVWGPPITSSLLPRIPSVSIPRSEGERIKAALARGDVRIWLRSRVNLWWGRPQLPVASIAGGAEGHRFLLIGAHLDSWYQGATDNATGDAAALELARLFGRHRNRLRRGVRIAWWPGHSQGRYAGSTWFGDRFFQELWDGAVAYLNIDSPGVKGGVGRSSRCMAEVEDFQRKVWERLGAGEIATRRPSRDSDQSFWGIGVPTLFPHAANLSAVKWFSHTPADTLDKADPQVLADDVRLLMGLAWPLCTEPVLPLRPSHLVGELVDQLEERQRIAEGRFDLGPVLRSARGLQAEVADFEQTIHRRLAASLDEEKTEVVNRTLVRFSRWLTPVLFTRFGPFAQDPALPQPLLPGLAILADLPHAPEDLVFRIQTEALRERNRIGFAIEAARREVREAKQRLGDQEGIA